MVHNFLISRRELDRVDFDIPAIFRWIEQQPVFEGPGGKTTGFVSRHVYLYKSLGWNLKQLDQLPATEKTRLRAMAPLRIPISTLRELRDHMDRDFKKQTVGPLEGVLGNDGLAALIQSLLAAPEQEKSILVIGAGNGANDSQCERKIVEFLFGVLPYHCRRRLTFATYDDDPLTSSRKSAPHRQRRLLCTTSFNDVKLPNSPANYPMWVVHAELKKAPVVPPVAGSVTRWYVKEIINGNFEAIFRVRDLASNFAYGTELLGMEDAFALFQDEQPPYGRDQFERFCRQAAGLRRSSHDYFKVACRFVRAWPAFEDRDSSLLDKLTNGYLNVLAKNNSRATGDAASIQRAIEHDCRLLMKHSALLGAKSGCSEILAYLFKEPNSLSFGNNAVVDLIASLQSGICENGLRLEFLRGLHVVLESLPEEMNDEERTDLKNRVHVAARCMEEATTRAATHHVLVTLDYIKSSCPPKILAQPITNALPSVVTHRIQNYCRHEAVQQNIDDADKAIRLLPVVLYVVDNLDDTVLVQYWDCLKFALVNLTQEEWMTNFPVIFQLGAKLQKRNAKDDLWAGLFSILRNMYPESEFRAMFLCAGESLFTDIQLIPTDKDLERLFKLRRHDDYAKIFHSKLKKQKPRGIRRVLWYMIWGLFWFSLVSPLIYGLYLLGKKLFVRSGVAKHKGKDGLRKTILSDWSPHDVASDHTAGEAVLWRVRFASAWFGDEHPDLADILKTLAENQAGDQTDACASVFMGYLTCKGKSEIVSRIDGDCVVSNALGGPDVYDKLEALLRAEGFKNSESLVRHLREGKGRWRYWIWLAVAGALLAIVCYAIHIYLSRGHEADARSGCKGSSRILVAELKTWESKKK